MKYLSILFTIALLISCKEDANTVTQTNTTLKETTTSSKTNVENKTPKKTNSSTAINPYLNNIQYFIDASKGNPIEKFQALAETSAVQKIDISKENFASALKTAANFKHIFITVENHTVVKIDDVTKCKPSGSWATCVPYAYGYIKKGDMIYKEDYANNIIGRPDSKQRTMYLFI